MKKLLLLGALTIVVTNALFSQNLPSYVPTNGLVGYWPFNGNANDESGNGNHGIVDGAILTTDRNNSINKAYSFDGNNSFIHVKNSDNLNFIDKFSFSLWMNINKLPYDGLEHYFLSKYDISSPQFISGGYHMMLTSWSNNNGLAFRYRKNDSPWGGLGLSFDQLQKSLQNNKK